MTISKTVVPLLCVAIIGPTAVQVRGQQSPKGAVVTKAGITASRDVHALLDRVRTSLGGNAALLAVHSMTVEGVRALESATAQPEPFGYKVLFPDKYRAVKSAFTFVVNGEAFRLDPPGNASTSAMAKRNTVGSFAELCLLVLLRSPASVPLRADFEPPTDPNTRVVTFSGADDFVRKLEIDVKTARVKTLRHPGTLSSQSGQFAVVRVVTIDEYARFGKILVPVRMTEQIVNSRAMVTFKTVAFDAGVVAEDFALR